MKQLQYKLALLRHFNADSIHILRPLRTIKLNRDCVAHVKNGERVPNKSHSRGIQSAKTVHIICIGFAKTVRRKVPKNAKTAKFGIQNTLFNQKWNPKLSILVNNGIMKHHGDKNEPQTKLYQITTH